jgi:outer membrane lipoprotein SlyB
LGETGLMVESGVGGSFEIDGGAVVSMGGRAGEGVGMGTASRTVATSVAAVSGAFGCGVLEEMTPAATSDTTVKHELDDIGGRR